MFVYEVEQLAAGEVQGATWRGDPLDCFGTSSIPVSVRVRVQDLRCLEPPIVIGFKHLVDEDRQCVPYGFELTALPINDGFEIGDLGIELAEEFLG
jgi:hypothetical protein